MIKIVSIFFGLCLSLSIYSQESIFLDAFNMDDGLSDNYIQDILEDENGIMWFSTMYGLNTFDGSRFKTYLHEDSISTSILRNDILASLKDDSGRLWFGSLNGTSFYYNPEKDAFVDVSLNYVTLQEYPTFLGFYKKGTSEMYGLSAAGVFRFSIYSHRFHKAFRELNEVLESHILSLHIDSEGAFWMGTANKGLLWISSDSTQITKVDIYPEIYPVQPRIQTFLPLSDSVLLLGTSSGLFTVTKHAYGTAHVKRVYEQLNNVFVGSLIKDSEGRIWVGTNYSGLWVAKDENTISHIEDNQTSNIPIAIVKTMFCDSKGRVWIGSYGNGLFMYNPVKSVIVNTTTESGLVNNVVSALSTDSKGNIWIGTDGGGISIFSPQLKLLKNIIQENGLLSNSILDLDLSGNKMWVSTWQGGIASIDVETYKLQIYNSANSKLPYDGLKSSAFVAKDSLIIGTHKLGLCSMNTKTGEVYDSLDIEYEEYFPSTQMYVNQVFVDSDGIVWVATIRNLYYIKNQKAYEVIKNDSHYYPHNPTFVHTVTEDPQGYILIGTNKSLFRFNKKNKKLESLIEFIPEIQNSQVITIHVDKNRMYWVATTKGLFVINPVDLTYKKVILPNSSNGLFFYPRAVCEAADGKLFFGTTKGLYSFYPDEITWENSISNLHFSDLFISYVKEIPGSDLLPFDINYIDKLVLPHDKQVWGISFNSVCYNYPHATKYAYILEGFDSKWNMLNNKQEITFTNIPPGNYTLTIKAWQFNPDNAIVRSLKITILPPWWNSWTVRVLIFILISSILFFIYKARLYKLEKQKNLLKKEVKSQTETLQEKNDQIEEQNAELLFVTQKLEETNIVLSTQKIELEDLTKLLQEESEELSELNDTLSQVNNTQNQLFSIITHDVRNSFMSIYGICNSLTEDYHEFSPELIKRQLSLISQAVINTSDMLENLMSWSKSQSKSIECNPDFCDVDSIVSHVVSSYQHMVSEKNITVHYTSIDNYIAYVDREMIITVLRNVFNNALKFTPKNGVIQIDINNSDDSIIIIIKDSGIGIDKDLLQELLQLDKGITRKHSTEIHGTGLGLIVSKQFVEKNKGTIQIESFKNKGTSFIISLPRAKQNVSLSNVLPSKRDNTNDTNFPIIAIIDDNSSILSLLHGYIEQDYDCNLFVNPKEFLDSLENSKFDVIISDIMMPEVDGFTLCQTVKKNPEISHIPVILISSKTDDEIKSQAYKSGADAFIEKPISKLVFKALVDKMLLQKLKYEDKPTIILSKSVHNNFEKEFLKNFDKVLKHNIANASFSIEDMAAELNLSRTQLFRKVKQYYEMSPKDYLIKSRLHASAELLQYENTKIIDIAYATGFSDPSYFSRCFLKYYKVTPTEYRDLLLNM